MPTPKVHTGEPNETNYEMTDQLEHARESRDFAIDALKKIDDDNSESLVWALVALIDLEILKAEAALKWSAEWSADE